MTPQNSSAGDAELESLEGQALEKVKKSISAIEEAIAAYDGAAVKPPGLEKKYEHYRKMHAFLTRWAREYLLESGRMNREQRIERLKKLEFFLMYGEG